MSSSKILYTQLQYQLRCFWYIFVFRYHVQKHCAWNPIRQFLFIIYIYNIKCQSIKIFHTEFFLFNSIKLLHLLLVFGKVKVVIP